MMTKRHFVVITHGRTGSSLVTESLREAGVAAFGELMHDDAEVRAYQTHGVVSPYGAGDDGAEYLRAFYASGEEPRGFKLFYEQARTSPAATAWDFIGDHPEVAVIHLIRRDLLAAWVSYEIAQRTDVWGLSEEEQAPSELPPFEIDANELSRFFDRVVAQRAWIRSQFRRPEFLELRYEEDLRDRFDLTMSRILELIGATDVADPYPVLTRLRHDPVERQISNFEALREHFRHTLHEEYFERPFTTGRTTSHPGFCPKPFEYLAVDAHGKLRVCCEDWLPTPIGDVRSASPKQQWNSPMAVAIRESILDGSYRYCNESQCPDLVKGTLLPLDSLTRNRHRRWVSSGRTVLDELPRTLNLGYDPSCNLKCATCRSDFIVLEGRAFDRAAAIQEDVLSELLPRARVVIITGHGDAIASRLYRRFLQSFDASAMPDLRILLMTNGLALDAIMWDSFRAAHPAIAGASISIDAATPETYAINRGGGFQRLLRNLRFLGGLHRRGEIEFLEISFVVQTNNFREMPAFVELANELGCSTVLFMKLIYWPGTFDESELEGRSIHESNHPLHHEFLEILRDPIFGDPKVDLSNLADLRMVEPSPREQLDGG